MANVTLSVQGNWFRAAPGSFCTIKNQTTAITGNQATGQTWHFPVGWDGVKISDVLPITYRETWLPQIPKFSSVKGTTLTNEEIDANFKVLQDGLISWAEELEWARAIIANRFIQIKDITEDYTLVEEDSYNTLIRSFANDFVTVWLPMQADVKLPIGSAILVSWNGSTDGIVTVAAKPGVTLVSPDTFDIARRYGKVTAIKTGPDYWELEGNLAIAT
jgi:hypothetical protein